MCAAAAVPWRERASTLFVTRTPRKALNDWPSVGKRLTPASGRGTPRKVSGGMTNPSYSRPDLWWNADVGGSVHDDEQIIGSD